VHVFQIFVVVIASFVFPIAALLWMIGGPNYRDRPQQPSQ
jgi:hypothetical protein